jgi:hypothetical protein
MKEFRKTWFSNFLNHKTVDSKNLLQFHLSAGIGDKNVDVVMDRGKVRTQSISQVVLSEGNLQFYYQDLTTNLVSKMTFSEALQG